MAERRGSGSFGRALLRLCGWAGLAAISSQSEELAMIAQSAMWLTLPTDR